MKWTHFRAAGYTPLHGYLYCLFFVCSGVLSLRCRQCSCLIGQDCGTGECEGDVCMVSYTEVKAPGSAKEHRVEKGCVSVNATLERRGTFLNVSDELACTLVADLDITYTIGCACKGHDHCNAVFEPPKINFGESVVCRRGTPRSEMSDSCIGEACFYSTASVGCLGSSTLLTSGFLESISPAYDSVLAKRGDCFTVKKVEQCICKENYCNSNRPPADYDSPAQIVKCHDCMGDTELAECGICTGSACKLHVSMFDPEKNQRTCLNSTTTSIDTHCTLVGVGKPTNAYMACTCTSDFCNANVSTAQPQIENTTGQMHLPSSWFRREALNMSGKPEIRLETHMSIAPTMAMGSSTGFTSFSSQEVDTSGTMTSSSTSLTSTVKQISATTTTIGQRTVNYANTSPVLGSTPDTTESGKSLATPLSATTQASVRSSFTTANSTTWLATSTWAIFTGKMQDQIIPQNITDPATTEIGTLNPQQPLLPMDLSGDPNIVNLGTVIQAGRVINDSSSLTTQASPVNSSIPVVEVPTTRGSWRTKKQWDAYWKKHNGGGLKKGTHFELCCAILFVMLLDNFYLKME